MHTCPPSSPSHDDNEISHRLDALVVTSISRPNAVLRSLAQDSQASATRFLVIGDSKSPEDFSLDGCEFISLSAQRASGLRIAQLLPERKYSRKNIGYLLMAQNGAKLIAETDDDNFALPNFWTPRARVANARLADSPGWHNAYAEFGQSQVWPRGFPLQYLKQKNDSQWPIQLIDAPIQQALADENPDVDAVFRMTRNLPVHFSEQPPLALAPRTWCPFNSQATFWFRDAFALMYLPTFCSFRMTDIWRSFVAQRVAWTCGWHIRFESVAVRQERNDHDLLVDFADEIPGYLHNDQIRHELMALPLSSGRENIKDNMLCCYRRLRKIGMIESDAEFALLDAWLLDLDDSSR